jgi:hypothetical protein
MPKRLFVVIIAGIIVVPHGRSADRLLGVQSARVMSQSMPWIAQETGIFRKYDLEFPLVYIGTSPLATVAMLGGEAQILIDGGLDSFAPPWAETMTSRKVDSSISCGVGPAFDDSAREQG